VLGTNIFTTSGTVQYCVAQAANDASCNLTPTLYFLPQQVFYCFVENKTMRNVVHLSSTIILAKLKLKYLRR